ncbi:MAG: D-aminoacylase [Gemmatimonadota bacterium]|nr:D-aminoacylase [Gemmatimonadota bacterium]
MSIRPHPLHARGLAAALFLASAGLAAPAAAQTSTAPVAPAAAVLIRGGTLVDGSGGAPRRADVRISGDRIISVAPSLTAAAGERVIDATGLTVSPGFIDVHSHADRGIDRAPMAESQIRQGITTSIVGQDGGSALPIASFLDDIDRLHPTINFATMVGHGSVRAAVMGDDFHRAATPGEIATMQALVDRGMKDGAVGLSSGVEYDPGFFAKPSEIVALAKMIKPYGGVYSSHVRDEENGVLSAWKEVIDLGRAAGVPVNISHAKLASKPVWGTAREALALLDNAAKSGVKVTADWYPYTFWSSSMYVLIPDRNFENRHEWEVGLDEIGGAQNVMVTGYQPDSTLNGHTIAEIAQMQGKDPVTVIIQMMRTAGQNIGIMATAMDERDLARFVADPRVMFCSDGGLSGAHPRGYGSFPRILGVYVREKHLLTLPEAVRKMTSATAQFLGLTDRGTLAAGKAADVVIFDPATIADRGTKTNAAQSPVGIRYVIVNGQVVLEDGRMTGARPGRGIRRHNWKAYAPGATR